VGVRAKGGATDDLLLESDDGGVDAVVDDGNLDRFDTAAAAATGISVGSRLEEAGKVIDALDPWGIPTLCAR
jgi:hypothetical protein